MRRQVLAREPPGVPGAGAPLVWHYTWESTSLDTNRYLPHRPAVAVRIIEKDE